MVFISGRHTHNFLPERTQKSEKGQKMIIKNVTKKITLTSDCKVADKFGSRFMGLMGKKNLPKGSGLLIYPCNSIHMFFMKFPLDIIFISKEKTVVQTVEGIRPWHATMPVHKAYYALELPHGAIKDSNTVPGDKLDFSYG